MLRGKHVVVGVAGSIAAYKAAFFVRELTRAGAEVRVVMTEAATRFIAPLTMATLSGEDVVLDMFPSDQSKGTWHIHLGLWADVMIIAPASANSIAKLAHGLADNALTSLALALRCPLVVAPAMDADMLLHVATQENLALLKKRGVFIIDPEEGELASGLTGPGRLPDAPVLLRELESLFTGQDADQNETQDAAQTPSLAGRRVVVTAGPTHEAIDPVRYLGNRSSGKMGFALARVAAERGAEVTLITGPVHLEAPSGVERIDVESALEMREAVFNRADGADIIVMAAAVADFTPEQPSSSKIKKRDLEQRDFALQLRRTPDILKQLGESGKAGVLVGFALETDDGEIHATRKLREKGADMIVLNDPGVEGAGFGTDTNVATLFFAGGAREDLELMPKIDLADIILRRAAELLEQKNS